jgi:hypothetical protein
VFARSRGVNTHGRFGCQGRSFLSRVSCQDFENIRGGYAK